MLSYYWQTLLHKFWVAFYLGRIAGRLLWRALWHDMSKLGLFEARHFTPHLKRLRGSTYGSAEYEQMRKEDLKAAIDHHYARNRHHPEFHEGGVEAMTVVDWIEMLADWASAVKRHADGDLAVSLVKNRERFGYSEARLELFRKVCRDFGLLEGDGEEAGK